MKKTFLLFSIVVITSCSLIKNQTNEDNIPQTFNDAESWFENQFEPIEINSNVPYILISTNGDTTYFNLNTLAIISDFILKEKL